MIGLVITLINLIYYALFVLLLLRFILVFVNGAWELRAWVERLTEPLLAPIRRFLPSAGGLDFSPLVLLILAQLVRVVLIGLLA
ncbi:MAG: YggT family protein [Candidatus Promineifilaceae bacterium]